MATQSKKSQSNSKQDIVQIILEDHKPIKKLIKTMKDEDATFTQKKKAFRTFAPTLIAHAKPEEQTCYVNMKADPDTKIEGLEGDVEHGLADQLCKELKKTTNKDVFMAKVKVLAELVEHHIEEEEEKLLPDFKKHSTLEDRQSLGAKYLALQKKYE